MIASVISGSKYLHTLLFGTCGSRIQSFILRSNRTNAPEGSIYDFGQPFSIGVIEKVDTSLLIRILSDNLILISLSLKFDVNSSQNK